MWRVLFSFYVEINKILSIRPHCFSRTTAYEWWLFIHSRKRLITVKFIALLKLLLKLSSRKKGLQYVYELILAIFSQQIPWLDTQEKN